ncbi:MAG: hypothetical protein AB3N16_15165, partial [Flavobacteriaceae bacterium]
PDPNQGDHDWIIKMSGNMDKDKIRKLIEVARVVNEVRGEWVVAKREMDENPTDTTKKRNFKNVQKKRDRWEERFRLFRMGTTFFYIVSSFVNVDILTTDYFKKLMQTMDFSEFMVSILSIYPKLEIGKMFYPTLSSKNFFSDGFNYTRRDDFGTLDNFEECSLDLKYVWHDQPLEAGLDTGNMCSLPVGQPQGRVYRGLKEFYTLPPKFLPELGKEFRDFFKYHKLKELHLYHDRAANNYESVGEDHASKIKKAIEYNEDGSATGWVVTLMNRNQPTISQQQEHELFLDLLSGRNPDLPLLVIDRHNCPNWKSSMELAEKLIRTDKHGNKRVHKIKTSEKLPKNELPKRSTNFSDAGKYLMCRPEYLEKTKGESSRMTGMPSTH